MRTWLGNLPALAVVAPAPPLGGCFTGGMWLKTAEPLSGGFVEGVWTPAGGQPAVVLGYFSLPGTGFPAWQGLNALIPLEPDGSPAAPFGYEGRSGCRPGF